MDESAWRRFRSKVLAACGARGPLIAELLAYTESPFAGLSRPPPFPLTDEAHVESWLEYEADAREIGAFAALKRRFPQLSFPIRAGMSEEESYGEATRKGVLTDPSSLGLTLRRPAELELTVHPTLAGRIPVVVASAREDFVTLVRAFTCRNEPVPVPDSMGACLVKGLNNWDRIAKYRREWETRAKSTDGAAWAEEFRQLIPRKELYQDRFILLSRGPYSAVSAEEAGLPQEEWLARSLVIRREHELTHYFTYRVFGLVRNHLQDELVADFVGLVESFGHYRRDLALRFLGLEAYPRYRQGGRLEHYLGQPDLSDDAFGVLSCLAFRAVQNLEELAAREAGAVSDRDDLARLTFALFGLSFEELASEEMGQRTRERLRAACASS